MIPSSREISRIWCWKSCQVLFLEMQKNVVLKHKTTSFWLLQIKQTSLILSLPDRSSNSSIGPSKITSSDLNIRTPNPDHLHRVLSLYFYTSFVIFIFHNVVSLESRSSMVPLNIAERKTAEIKGIQELFLASQLYSEKLASTVDVKLLHLGRNLRLEL